MIIGLPRATYARAIHIMENTSGYSYELYVCDYTNNMATEFKDKCGKSKMILLLGKSWCYSTYYTLQDFINKKI